MLKEQMEDALKVSFTNLSIICNFILVLLDFRFLTFISCTMYNIFKLCY